LLSVFPWSRGTAILNIGPEKGPWTPISPAELDWPVGVDVATEIVLTHADGARPTMLVFTEAAFRLTVEGAPYPAIILEMFTDAELKRAIEGGAR
jgi:hypothetical protein